MTKQFSLICLVLIQLSSCSKSTSDAQTLAVEPKQEPAKASFNGDAIAATLGDRVISIAQLDASMQIQLHDLEYRKFELRRAKLKALIQEQNELSSSFDHVKILLQPPTPPRLELPNSHYPSQAASPNDSVITLSLFCSYQSSHCTRIQPVLKTLRDKYNRIITTEYFDLPQGFHRYGKSAANAAHCATEQGIFQRYQSSLYSQRDNLTYARLRILAQQLHIDMSDFGRCLEAQRHLPKIHRDIDYANRMGFGNVPTIFVNGLYIKGPQTAELYSYYIEQELARLSQARPIRSYLPLELVAIEQSKGAPNDKSASSIAHIRTLTDNLSLFLQAGDAVDELTLVETVRSDSVVLNHNKIRLLLPIEPDSTAMSEKKKAAADQKPDGHQKKESNSVIAMALSKDWIQEQLQDQTQLARHFELAAHKVEGVHLLKLRDIDKLEFYSVLGLRSGDVVLQINEEFVHEAQNPLWQTLHQEAEFEMLVMRQGFPIRYRFTID